MHYSFVRSYLDLNQADKLLQIFKLKVIIDFLRLALKNLNFNVLNSINMVFSLTHTQQIC